MCPASPELPVRLPVRDAASARLLRQHHAFLRLFLEPRSPSEVARDAGVAANLAHHRTRRLAAAGLLREVRRGGGRVYYQLAAREFRVPWDVLPPLDDAGGTPATLRDLSGSFLHAYERSVRAASAHEEHVIGFGSGAEAKARAPIFVAKGQPPAEAHPAHLDALTLRLAHARYRQLVADLTALLNAALSDHRPDGPPCTVAVLAYAGPLERTDEPATLSVSRHTSTFLGSPAQDHEP